MEYQLHHSCLSTVVFLLIKPQNQRCSGMFERGSTFCEVNGIAAQYFSYQLLFERRLFSCSLTLMKVILQSEFAMFVTCKSSYYWAKCLRWCYVPSSQFIGLDNVSQVEVACAAILISHTKKVTSCSAQGHFLWPSLAGCRCTWAQM